MIRDSSAADHVDTRGSLRFCLTLFMSSTHPLLMGSTFFMGLVCGPD